MENNSFFVLFFHLLHENRSKSSAIYVDDNFLNIIYFKKYSLFYKSFYY